VEQAYIGMLTRAFAILNRTQPHFRWEIYQLP
jgi:hypothetical protein